ncbi:hypothetical protein MPSEU_000207700 [Mayamaea pseudoterrestris]|nr:hypothetical protein MPSEU_000207700 [Mayamaea pseudoterrestris]
MKLTIKTLKGEKFQLEVDESKSVEELKGLIEAEKSELPAAGMKIIHSGKVLKEGDSIASCGIKPNDFLVVMVAKTKKPAAATVPEAPAATAAAAEEPKTPAPAASTQPSPAAPPAPARDSVPQEAVDSLTAMGFPEAEVRHCLRAADGNADVAVEFLTNGIPEGVQQASMGEPAVASPAAASTGQPLQALRSHPQFNQLRTVVQNNPGMLQQVLAQIGQQQPELLTEINANQALFLQMMNEPVATGAPSGSSAGSGGVGAAGMDAAAGGVAAPSQMAQMIQSMGTEEVAQMAQMMGISPEQLRQTAQMIGSLPPEQLNRFMMQAMGGDAGGDDMDDMMMAMMGGGNGGAGGAPAGATVLHLTEEEMAAVDRLTEMGFDRSEAAQAFLACDKNEALAANLLMDSMGDGGFFSGGGESGGGNNGNGGNGGGGNDDDDDDAMYE